MYSACRKRDGQRIEGQSLESREVEWFISSVPWLLEKVTVTMPAGI